MEEVGLLKMSTEAAIKHIQQQTDVGAELVACLPKLAKELDTHRFSKLLKILYGVPLLSLEVLSTSLTMLGDPDLSGQLRYALMTESHMGCKIVKARANDKRRLVDRIIAVFHKQTKFTDHDIRNMTALDILPSLRDTHDDGYVGYVVEALIWAWDANIAFIPVIINTALDLQVAKEQSKTICSQLLEYFRFLQDQNKLVLAPHVLISLLKLCFLFFQYDVNQFHIKPHHWFNLIRYLIAHIGRSNSKHSLSDSQELANIPYIVDLFGHRTISLVEVFCRMFSSEYDQPIEYGPHDLFLLIILSKLSKDYAKLIHKCILDFIRLRHVNMADALRFPGAETLSDDLLKVINYLADTMTPDDKRVSKQIENTLIQAFESWEESRKPILELCFSQICTDLVGGSRQHKQEPFKNVMDIVFSRHKYELIGYWQMFRDWVTYLSSFPVQNVPNCDAILRNVISLAPLSQALLDTVLILLRKYSNLVTPTAIQISHYGYCYLAMQDALPDTQAEILEFFIQRLTYPLTVRTALYQTMIELLSDGKTSETLNYYSDTMKLVKMVFIQHFQGLLDDQRALDMTRCVALYNDRPTMAERPAHMLTICMLLAYRGKDVPFFQSVLAPTLNNMCSFSYISTLFGSQPMLLPESDLFEAYEKQWKQLHLYTEHIPTETPWSSELQQFFESTSYYRKNRTQIDDYLREMQYSRRSLVISDDPSVILYPLLTIYLMAAEFCMNTGFCIDPQDPNVESGEYFHLRKAVQFMEIYSVLALHCKASRLQSWTGIQKLISDPPCIKAETLVRFIELWISPDTPPEIEPSHSMLLCCISLLHNYVAGLRGTERVYSLICLCAGVLRKLRKEDTKRRSLEEAILKRRDLATFVFFKANLKYPTENSVQFVRSQTLFCLSNLERTNMDVAYRAYFDVQCSRYNANHDTSLEELLIAELEDEHNGKAVLYRALLVVKIMNIQPNLAYYERVARLMKLSMIPAIAEGLLYFLFKLQPNEAHIYQVCLQVLRFRGLGEYDPKQPPPIPVTPASVDYLGSTCLYQLSKLFKANVRRPADIVEMADWIRKIVSVLDRFDNNGFDLSLGEIWAAWFEFSHTFLDSIAKILSFNQIPARMLTHPCLLDIYLYSLCFRNLLLTKRNYLAAHVKRVLVLDKMARKLELFEIVIQQSLIADFLSPADKKMVQEVYQNLIEAAHAEMPALVQTEHGEKDLLMEENAVRRRRGDRKRMRSAHPDIDDWLLADGVMDDDYADLETFIALEDTISRPRH